MAHRGSNAAPAGPDAAPRSTFSARRAACGQGWHGSKRLAGDNRSIPSNLDLVRSIYAAWERGEFGSAEWADPEIEFVFADGPSPGSFTGLTGMAEGTRSWINAWEDVRPVAEEYRTLDGERVVVLVRGSGRGKTSGVDLAQMGASAAHLFHVRDGKVTRFVFYFNRERAFADLGLAPEADAP